MSNQELNCEIIEKIDHFNDSLEDLYENDIDFYGELKQLKDYIDSNMKIIRKEIEKTSNSPHRHGTKWVLKWYDISGKTTINKALMKEKLGDDIFSKYETVGKPSTGLTIEKLIDDGDPDVTLDD